MVYVICLGTIILLLILYLIFHKFFERHSSVFLKVFSVLIFAVFAVRYYASSGSLFSDVTKLSSGNPFFDEALKPFSFATFSDAFCAVIAVDTWLEISSVLVVTLAPFFSRQRVLGNVAKTFTMVFSVVNLALVRWTAYSYTGSYDLDVCAVLTAVEAALVFLACLHALYYGKGFRVSKKEFARMAYVLPVILLFTVPSYLPRALFGDFGYSAVISFKSYHRGYIYLAVLLVIGLYFYLRRKDPEYVRMVLLFASLGAVITYCSRYDYTSLYTISEWPLHLCNAVLFLIPLCLIFRFDWLFCFTFFFGVLGAFVAMFMPTYATTSGVLSPDTISYWQNHVTVFAVPLVMLFTGVYARPKTKHFFYALIGFLAYFLVVTAVNPYLETDFFFMNGDRVTSLFGSFGSGLKDTTMVFGHGDGTVTYYPVYQVVSFVVYAVAAFVVRLVFLYIFRVQDRYLRVEDRRREIRAEEYAACERFGVKDIDDCVNGESVGKIVLRNVYKRYGDSPVYSAADVSFEVGAGEIVGFLGHNGAGKSTIIKAIVGIHPMTSGSIEVNGYDVATRCEAVKAQIGFVPDHYALYESLTGREYVNHVADLYGVSKKDRVERLARLCEKLRMTDSIDSKIETYSHGMKQKVAIIAALIHDPKVLILDEPLTGLDPVSVYEVKECMREHAEKGNIVFFSSHLIDVVEKLCTRIIIIKGGVIQASEQMDRFTDSEEDLEQYFIKVGGGSDRDIRRVPVPEDIAKEEKLDFLFREKHEKSVVK